MKQIVNFVDNTDQSFFHKAYDISIPKIGEMISKNNQWYKVRMVYYELSDMFDTVLIEVNCERSSLK